MDNGELRMENGELRMENGEWRMENGELVRAEGLNVVTDAIGVSELTNHVERLLTGFERFWSKMLHRQPYFKTRIKWSPFYSIFH